MPGLIGIIGRGACSEKRHQLEAMMRATHREEFYRRGTFVDESLGSLCWLDGSGRIVCG